ncbi:Major intrinsic protein domain containing protein [Aphelenchoides bicaudatus]|nr:Major intrinsic protein domain containing protein [Aphelenchoides bicaudatus]
MASDRLNHLNVQFHIKSQLHRALLAEFMATMLLMYVGFSINAQTTLSRGQNNTNLGNTIGWGLSLLFAVMMGWNITGSHVNPAISFCAWTFNELKFSHFVLYSIVQTIASFFGALFTFVLYYDKINEFDEGVRQVRGINATAGIFATYPGDHLSMLGGIIDQVSCTTVMVIMVYMITDEKNQIPKWVQPAFISAMLVTVGMGFGLNAGNAMNPARDFGPRLFTLFAGYGMEVFSYNNYGWCWIPIICPMFGTVFGAWLYKFLIGFQLPDPEFPSNLPKSISNNPSQITTLYSSDSPPLKVMVERSSSESTVNSIKI